MIAVFLALSVSVHAQQPAKISRIGYVEASGDSKTPGPRVEAFQQGLRDLGYVEGKNILIEYRYAEAKLERIPRLVDELVQLKVDVLVVSALTAIRAAKEKTTTIPIVMVTTLDPVATGIVESLAHPGGNITGLTTLLRDLGGKRLELLKEIIPGISRVGVLWDADAPSAPIAYKEYETVARALKIQLQSLEVRGPNPDLQGVFQAAVKRRAGALIVIRSPLLLRFTKRIADLANKNRLASIYDTNQFVEAGGTASYSAKESEAFRRAAVFVDKILKGRKPADLPVERPMKFELVINLKTAKEIGLTIPQWTLMKADRVIQ